MNRNRRDARSRNNSRANNAIKIKPIVITLTIAIVALVLALIYRGHLHSIEVARLAELREQEIYLMLQRVNEGLYTVEDVEIQEEDTTIRITILRKYIV